MTTTADKQTLRLQLDASRHQAGRLFQALREDVAVGPRIKASVTRHPAGWFSAAAVIGLLVSRVPFSRSKSATKKKPTEAEAAGVAALSLAALKMALTFAKPAFTKWVEAKFKQAAGARSKHPV
jgi:hypothetical protein